MDEPIDLKRWRDTPVVHGRPANDDDVREGRAVFAVGGDPIVEFDLPAPAIVSEEGVGEATPVIVVQVERLEDGAVIVGYRIVDGGSGVAPLEDVEFLSEPDERFR